MLGQLMEPPFTFEVDWRTDAEEQVRSLALGQAMQVTKYVHETSPR